MAPEKKTSRRPSTPAPSQLSPTETLTPSQSQELPPQNFDALGDSTSLAQPNNAGLFFANEREEEKREWEEEKREREETRRVREEEGREREQERREREEEKRQNEAHQNKLAALLLQWQEKTPPHSSPIHHGVLISPTSIGGRKALKPRNISFEKPNLGKQ